MNKTLVTLLLLIFACHHQTATEQSRVAAANVLTERFARSRIADWGVIATAAGQDCAVLVLHVDSMLWDDRVEAVWYGAGWYEVTPGGLQQFARENGFRQVVYDDTIGQSWLAAAGRPVPLEHRERDRKIGRMALCR
jgi:hypothetical protein